jgi:hypothetical protein
MVLNNSKPGVGTEVLALRLSTECWHTFSIHTLHACTHTHTLLRLLYFWSQQCLDYWKPMISLPTISKLKNNNIGNCITIYIAEMKIWTCTLSFPNLWCNINRKEAQSELVCLLHASADAGPPGGPLSHLSPPSCTSSHCAFVTNEHFKISFKK